MADNEPPKSPRSSFGVWLILLILAAALGGGFIWYVKSQGGPRKTVGEEVSTTPPPGQQQVAVSGQVEGQGGGAPAETATTGEAPTTQTTTETTPAETTTTAAASAETSTTEAPPPTQTTTQPAAPPTTAPAQSKVVDLAETQKKGTDQAETMEKRKEELGLKQSLDAVVKEDETVKVGKAAVPMGQIVAQIEAKEKEREAAQEGTRPAGEASSAESKTGTEPAVPEKSQPVKEEELSSAGSQDAAPKPAEAEKTSAEPRTAAAEAPQETQAPSEKSPEPAPAAAQEEGQAGSIAHAKAAVAEQENEPAEYGIHLVKPGENLWEIHFNILREYFANKGITLDSHSDQPDPEGHSSGVARILKYAERMVYIYNVRTKELSEDLDVIQPEEKIVVFNITRLDKVLKNLDQEKIKRVRLEGEKLIVVD